MSEWRPIPDFEDYLISDMGKVVRILKDGTRQKINPYLQKNGKMSTALAVHLYDKDGKKTTKRLLGLMARTFIGPVPEGKTPHFINGMSDDVRIGNIEYICQSAFGKINGSKAFRKPVVKIDLSGQDVDYYKSAREAAEKNFMSVHAMRNRCNGKYKGPCGEFDFAWDDSQVSRRWAIRRIEQSQDYIPPMPSPKYEFEF